MKDSTERVLKPPRPEWFPCYWAPGKPKCGELLVSFVAIQQEHHSSPDPLDISRYIKFADFQVNILVLGMRNLQSPGILPVKKSFIVFNLRSLLPENKQYIENIKTLPKATGSSPTLNTTMHMKL